MAAPFLRDPVDQGAILVRLAFHTNRVLCNRQDPLFHTDEFLFERYRFSRQGLIYLQDLLGPYIANITRRNKLYASLWIYAAVCGYVTLCFRKCLVLSVVPVLFICFTVGEWETYRFLFISWHVKKLTRKLLETLTVLPTLCIAFRFFASGTFLYSVGDAENIGKAAACVAVRKVYLMKSVLMNQFIIFPGHVPVN